MKIYMLKNETVNYFNKPIFCESDNEALSIIRSTVASDPTNALLKLADEMTVYHVGEVNFATGEISGNKRGPRVLVHLCDFMKDFKEKNESEVINTNV